MSEKSLGCLGCLGTLVFLSFIGSLIFGGGFLVRVGSFMWGVNHPIDRQQIVNDYFTELEDKQKTVVAEAVKQFHEQLNQGKCQEIYEQANEAFRQQGSQSEFSSSCERIHREFGLVTSTQKVDWWGRFAAQDSDYILSRHYTIFSNSSALSSQNLALQETFIWLVKDSKPELVQYQSVPINSDAGQLKSRAVVDY